MPRVFCLRWLESGGLKMFNTPQIQTTVDQIENNLKKLGFNEKEISYWLVRFELAIREAIGKKILSEMSKEKRLEIEKMVAEGKNSSDLTALIKDYANLDEIEAIYQEKLEEIDQELTSWTNELLPVFAEVKERIEKEILPRTSLV